MRYRVALLAAIVAALVPTDTTLAGEAGRNRAERAQDRQELRQNRRETTDDRTDRRTIDTLVERFEAARIAEDRAALAEIDEEVFDYILDEAAEAGVEAARSKREARRAKRELRSDRREQRKNRRTAAPRRERLDDRRDTRDDRRDLRDDRRDADGEVHRKAQLEEMVHGWESLLGEKSTSALDRRAEILTRLQAVARAEIGENAEERREDKRELREDRRETREDRRER